jgi:hypothetical protein
MSQILRHENLLKTGVLTSIVRGRFGEPPLPTSLMANLFCCRQSPEIVKAVDPGVVTINPVQL